MSAPPLPEASRSGAAQARGGGRTALRKSGEREIRPFVEAIIARGGGAGRVLCRVGAEWAAGLVRGLGPGRLSGDAGHLVGFGRQRGSGVGFGGGPRDRGEDLGGGLA